MVPISDRDKRALNHCHGSSDSRLNTECKQRQQNSSVKIGKQITVQIIKDA